MFHHLIGQIHFSPSALTNQMPEKGLKVLYPQPKAPYKVNNSEQLHWYIPHVSTKPLNCLCMTILMSIRYVRFGRVIKTKYQYLPQFINLTLYCAYYKPLYNYLMRSSCEDFGGGEITTQQEVQLSCCKQCFFFFHKSAISVQVV